MQHVVHVESSRNPFAIGVVGGHLQRQPQNLPEAVATANMLEQRGFNFSLGIAQVNRYNLQKYGLKSYAEAFAACPNLQAGSQILRECYDRSGKDWGKAFSCYYSGNFVTGYKEGYVQKIFASMKKSASPQVDTAALVQPIPVIGAPKQTKTQKQHKASASEPNRIAEINQPQAVLPQGTNDNIPTAKPAPSGPPKDEKFVF